MIECCATEIIPWIRSSICQIVIDRIQLFFGWLYFPRKLYIMRSGIDVIKQLLQVGVLFAIQVFVELYISKYYKLPQRERMFNISIPVLTGFNKLEKITIFEMK